MRFRSDPAAYRGFFASHFVYKSHRRLSGAFPVRNRAEFFSYIDDWVDFVQPASIRDDAVAVRGERLASSDYVVATTDSDEVRVLQVTRLTPDLDQIEWIGNFEPEQLEEALAELERQHSAIIGDGQD